MLVGVGENTIPDVFEFIRSTVKVTWVTFVTSLETVSTEHTKNVDYKA